MWVLDLTRNGDGSRVTTDPAAEMDPGWSSDGKFVVFNSNRQKGYSALFRRAADGSGEDDLVAQLPPPDILFSIADPSPDDRSLDRTGAGQSVADRKPSGRVFTPVRFMKVDEPQTAGILFAGRQVGCLCVL